MGRGYVAIKEKARRNQEVAAVKGDYAAGNGTLSSTWNATEKSWRKRIPKVERQMANEAAMETIQAWINAGHARDVKRGFVAKRLPKKGTVNARA